MKSIEEIADKYIREQYIDYGDLNDQAEIQIRDAVIFGLTKGQELPILNVSGSTDFKTLLKTNIIPRVELMEEKERKHLHWLIDNNAPIEFIATAQKHLFHYAERVKEYSEYYNELP